MIPRTIGNFVGLGPFFAFIPTSLGLMDVITAAAALSVVGAIGQMLMAFTRKG